MRFVIVGVGQTFNLETQQMEDVLQVQVDGSLISVPTTNEAAQQLIQMAMNGRRQEVSMGAHVGDPNLQMANSPYPLPPSTGTLRPQELPQDEDFPDGAEIFGGQVAAAPPQSAEGHMDQAWDEPEGLAEERPRMFAKTQQASQPRVDLGRTRNPADRSGVPSYGISRVDEKGNPVLPSPPDITIEDEEDPGEQV